MSAEHPGAPKDAHLQFRLTGIDITLTQARRTAADAASLRVQIGTFVLISFLHRPNRRVPRRICEKKCAKNGRFLRISVQNRLIPVTWRARTPGKWAGLIPSPGLRVRDRAAPSPSNGRARTPCS